MFRAMSRKSIRTAIDALIETHTALTPFASTLACPFPEDSYAGDPDCVKAVLGRARKGDAVFDALYFTRAPAPYARWDAPVERHLHIGVYAYSKASLAAFVATPPGRLEAAERLEQLRILEMGETIVVRVISAAPPGVDTQADLDAVRARMEKR